MNNELKESADINIDTSGGAMIEGSVRIDDGDLIGRDKNVCGDEVEGDKNALDSNQVDVFAVGRGAKATKIVNVFQTAVNALPLPFKIPYYAFVLVLLCLVLSTGSAVMVAINLTPVSLPSATTAPVVVVTSTYIYGGQVISDETEEPIRGAKVTVKLHDTQQIIDTDSKGFFWFQTESEMVSTPVRIDADGFLKYDQLFEFSTPNSEPKVIRMRPTPLMNEPTDQNH